MINNIFIFPASAVKLQLQGEQRIINMKSSKVRIDNTNRFLTLGRYQKILMSHLPVQKLNKIPGIVRHAQHPQPTCQSKLHCSVQYPEVAGFQHENLRIGCLACCLHACKIFFSLAYAWFCSHEIFAWLHKIALFSSILMGSPEVWSNLFYWDLLWIFPSIKKTHKNHIYSKN